METGPIASTTRSVGPYRLEELLGRGGMGEVYRAYDQRLARWVAIKHIRPDSADRPNVQARFRNEAWTAARLSHPAIVPIFDLVEEEDGDWIVLELVPGPTLAERLEEGPLSLADVVTYGRQIAEGLAEAHGKGILHRDLKPENVILAPSGQARILDFGVAKRLWKIEGESSISVAGEVVGTCRSMSPEQARGLALDARSDLFSLGTLLYEVLTGRSPFRGETPTDTLARVCSQSPRPVRELRPEVPEGLSALIQDLLQKPPELRPASAREVAERLADLAAALPPARPRVLPFPGAVPPDFPAAEPTVAATQSETSREPILSALAEPAELPSAAASAAASYRHFPRAGLGLGLGFLLLAAVATSFLPASFWRSTGGGTPLVTGDAYAHYQKGMALLERYDRQGNLDRAVVLFGRALTLDSRSAPAYAGLSLAYWRKAQEASDPVFREQALAAGRKAVELDGQLAVARVSLGLAELSLGRLPEATAEFEQARRLEPGDADAWRGLGEVALRQRKREAAEADFRKAIDLRPKDRELHDLLGSLYYRAGRYPEAEAEFQKSVAVAPDCAYGHRNLGAALYSEGRLDEAAKELQAALEIAPRSSVYANLGTLLFAQGLYQDAVTAFEQALQIGGAYNYQRWANLADAYRWTPDHRNEARRAYTRALQLLAGELAGQPDDPGLRSQRALYLAKRGDKERALTEVDQVFPNAGNDAEVLYRATVTYEIVGQREKALGALEAALRAGFSRDTVNRDPELLKLRADPRYQGFIAGLSG